MANPNPNTSGLKPLKKGYDPRRNLKGVPKDAIKGRALIRKIGAELIRIKEKSESGEDIEYDITRIEAKIRLMFSSRMPADNKTIFQALWPGIIQDSIELSNKEPVTLKVVYDDKRVQNPVTEASREADRVPGEPGEKKDNSGRKKKRKD